MRGVIGSSLQLRYLVVGIATVLMIVGLARLRQMPVDVLPEFAPPFVEVQTEAPGLSTTEVESLITLNLEELLNGTPWLQSIRSRSVPGLSSLVLTFQPGTDVIRARQLVQERLTVAYTLPNVSKPPVILQTLSATSRVMMIGLTSEEVSPIQLSVLAQWTIRPTLMGVPGVANVAVWGERRRQLQVQVDPERLRARGVSLDQVVKTTGEALHVSPLTFLNSSTPGTGGWIDTPNQRLAVRHVLPISSPEDLAQVVVDGADLRLGDVAEVVENHPPLIGDAIVNGRPGLLLVVEKFPGANTLAVTRALEETIDALRPGLSGVEIDTTIFRPATFIETSIDNLSGALLVGSLLVVLVLCLFLFEWRLAVISLVTIPLSLVAAGLVLYLRGATINTMALAGFVIALGAVVDDAIVDIENIVRRLRQHRREGTGRSTASVVLESSLEVRGAIGFATLIILLAVLPIFFTEGLTGAFFQPLALSYGLAVLASMAVALTVTPALGLLLLSGARLQKRESPVLRWLRGRYGAVLARTVRRPRAAFAGVGAAMLLGIGVFPFLGQSFLPNFKEQDLLVPWLSPSGTSHPEMYRITNELSGELLATPGVRSFGAHIGRAVMGDELGGMSSAQLWVSLKPTADYDATVEAVQAAVDGYPALVGEVQTYLRERIRRVLTGSSQAIVVRILGPELGVLRDKAGEVRDALAGIEGVVDLQMEEEVAEPHVEIQIDLDKAEPYGLKPGDIRRAAATLLAGLTVGSLFEEQKVFDVMVWSAPETRDSVSSIRGLLIDTPGGGHVRLGDVANVRVTSTPSVINREAVSRRIDVGLNVGDRDLGSVARDVKARLERVEFPLEYHAQILGEYAERQAAQTRILSVAAAVLIGIFLLLQACFGSWRLAILAFATLPAALVGGVLAAFINGGVLSLGSLVGFLTVLGIAARNGIMLISHYQHLEEHEGVPFGLGLVLRGAGERLTPIVMTALATGLALAPIAFFGEIPGFEIAHPMTVIILGGLVTSTLLNLFVVPALYLRVHPTPARAVEGPLTAHTQPSVEPIPGIVQPLPAQPVAG